MFNFLVKYGTLIFVLNTILLAIKQTFNIGNQIFISLMILFSFFLFINPKHIKSVLFHKAFSFMLIITVINIFYFLLFHEFNDIEAVKYLLARTVQFSIICFSVYYYYNYYSERFLQHVCWVVLLILLISFISDPFIFSGRYQGIVWNPNALSSFSSIAFAIMLMTKRRKNKIQIILMILFLLFSLLTGSRGSIVAIALAYLINYGLSSKNIVYSVLAIFLYLGVSNFQFETSINRLYSQGLFEDRVLQYEYGLKSIVNSPYSGYGLDKYSFIDKKLVPLELKSKIIGAHNGYLAILTQYGLIFGFFILYIILKKSYRSIIFVNKHKLEEHKIHIYIIIYTLIASLYESLMVGINEFHTILFWYSLAIILFREYNHNNENKTYT